jgi:hypothetical protein
MFNGWERLVDIFVYDIIGLDAKSHSAQAVHFFLFDTVKIYLLLVGLIFIISFLRTYFNTEKIRVYLQKRNTFTGNVLSALFGIITPFCSCSAIPLFLGFTQARIPMGITFSFLISSPMNNEVAIALLFGLFGWKITALYIGFGLLVAILGGYMIGMMKLERYLLIPIHTMEGELDAVEITLTFQKRVQEAWANTTEIFGKIYPYVLIGVGVGAFIHGYVPTELIVRYTGENHWYSVPLAVLMGVPMYASAASVLPLIEVLTGKGMLLGTALSLMMAITALSLPEALILKRILHVRLIAIYFGIVALGIVLVGYLFNALL